MFDFCDSSIFFIKVLNLPNNFSINLQALAMNFYSCQ